MAAINSIQYCYDRFFTSINPHRIGTYKMTSKSLSLYISDTCRYFNIPNFIFKQDYTSFEAITFVDCYNSQFNCRLWSLPSIKYRLRITNDLPIESKTYDNIVSNAVILLNINGVEPSVIYTDINEYIKLFGLACCLVINKHHIQRTNSSFFTDIAINDFVLKCICNLMNRIEDKTKLNEDIININKKNVEYVYKSKKVVTLGYAPKEVKHSISMKKFTNEQKIFVQSLKEQKVPYRQIQKLFQEQYEQQISLYTISGI